MRILRLVGLSVGLLLAIVVVAVLFGFVATITMRLIPGAQDQLTEALVVGFLGGLVPTAIMVWVAHRRQRG